MVLISHFSFVFSYAIADALPAGMLQLVSLGVKISQSPLK